MQQCLTLHRATRTVTAPTMRLQLRNVPCHRPPSPNLPLILTRQTSTHIVPAIPLKPSSRIMLFVDPSLGTPHTQRLARAHAEIIARRVIPFRRKFCVRKPTLRKLLSAVGHVLPAKDAKRKHFPRRQLRAKTGMKVFPDRRGTRIPIPFLHPVMHDHGTHIAYCTAKKYQRSLAGCARRWWDACRTRRG